MCVLMKPDYFAGSSITNYCLKQKESIATKCVPGFCLFNNMCYPFDPLLNFYGSEKITNSCLGLNDRGDNGAADCIYGPYCILSYSSEIFNKCTSLIQESG